MSSPERHSRIRFTWVELMFATALVVSFSTVLIGHIAQRHHFAVVRRDREFALHTARSLLAEVHAAAAAGTALERFDDRGVARSGLGLGCVDATERDPRGNRVFGGAWVWHRRIEVDPPAGSAAARRVAVEVSKRRPDGSLREIVSVATLIAGVAPAAPPRRVVDLHLLAIENAPLHGVDAAAIRPLTGAVLAELERREPGLEVRAHWITKSSYGRDPHYTPALETVPPDAVYTYPRTAPSADPGAYRYLPGAIKARLRDGTQRTGDADPDRNPLPYTLADAFNHGLRLADERELHAARVQTVRQRKAAIRTAQSTGSTVPPELFDMSEEPTWRLLLEGMHTASARWRGTRILDLHGDVLPMPALHNFADPVADEALAGVRCVTHPQELRVRRREAGREHDPVVLRVYAFTDRPELYRDAGVCPAGHAITLRLEGVDLTDHRHLGRLRPEVRLHCLAGGVPIVPAGSGTASADYRPFALAKCFDEPHGRGEMHYFAQFVDPGFGEEKYTLLWLFHTPVVCPQRRNSGQWAVAPAGAKVPGRGWRAFPAPIVALPPSPSDGAKVVADVLEDPAAGTVQGLGADAVSRPWGLEYVPAPVGPNRDFSRDLASPGDGPKNTARWRLTIGGAVLGAQCFVDARGKRSDPDRDVRLRVRTGFRKLSDTRVPDPLRESTTYVWWAAQRDAVPATERMQLLGDPRHLPYADAVAGDADFGGSANKFFDTLRRGGGVAAYGGLHGNEMRSGWKNARRLDGDAYLRLLRDGLERSAARLVSLDGVLPEDIVLGGEVGPGDRGTVRFGREPRVWWCKPWLGALYPAELRSVFVDEASPGFGNLPCSGGGESAPWEAVLGGTPPGSTLPHAKVAATDTARLRRVIPVLLRGDRPPTVEVLEPQAGIALDPARPLVVRWQPIGLTPGVPAYCVVMVSRDRGHTWRYLGGDLLALPGGPHPQVVRHPLDQAGVCSATAAATSQRPGPLWVRVEIRSSRGPAGYGYQLRTVEVLGSRAKS